MIQEGKITTTEIRAAVIVTVFVILDIRNDSITNDRSISAF
ncbi:hypothetical protein KL86DYS1_31524 [uncultured Dysgonomonas sp.]|uniref:Uncharacterized protein n=1 Tax=uncultured Dysgonomonas sp. TaxID=206096 RepID=A0A212K5L7_9BACT|nr:hypothetical protein KL86DYS1_31524 [uncultured Dysgonomonas sp.]